MQAPGLHPPFLILLLKMRKSKKLQSTIMQMLASGYSMNVFYSLTLTIACTRWCRLPPQSRYTAPWSPAPVVNLLKKRPCSQWWLRFQFPNYVRRYWFRRCYSEVTIIVRGSDAKVTSQSRGRKSRKRVAGACSCVD
nr:uncharacterized protein LOC127300898 isoform X5 [Lolium perenne]